MVDRFALAGFDALAPDLFKGVVVPYHDADAASKEMMSLDFMDATVPDRARRGPISEAERRQGRRHRVLHGRRGRGHRRRAYPGVLGRGHVLRPAAGRCGQARRRQDSVAGPFRQPRRLVSRRRWSTLSRRGSRPRARTSSSSATTPTTPSPTSSGCRCTTGTRPSSPGGARSSSSACIICADAERLERDIVGRAGEPSPCGLRPRSLSRWERGASPSPSGGECPGADEAARRAG